MLDVRVRLRNGVIKGDLVVVKRILRRYPKHLYNVNPENGWTSLHYAGYYGHYVLCAYLVSLGHDTQETSWDFKGNAPIHCTVLSRNSQTLLYLLQAFPDSIGWKGEMLRTPLHVASVVDFPNGIEVLLQKGANINSIDVDGNTPLHLALMYGAKECVHVLMVNNAYMDIRNAEGWLPEEVAKDVGIRKWFELLKDEIIANAQKSDNSEFSEQFNAKPSGGSSVLQSVNIGSSSVNSPVLKSPHRSQTDPNLMNKSYSNNDLLTGFIVKDKQNTSPKKRPTVQRKHSNSSPVLYKRPDSFNEDYIAEEPITPTYSTHSGGSSNNSILTKNKYKTEGSSSELISMSSPVFPPSIPPAPGSSLSSPSRTTHSPLSVLPLGSAFSSRKSTISAASQASGVSADSITSPQSVTFTKSRQRSNSNDIFSKKRGTRIHSNSLGAHFGAQTNNNDSSIFGNSATGFAGLSNTSKTSINQNASNSTLRGAKSSTSLNFNIDETKQLQNRSRASSIHNMINTPGKYRSNTILSYASSNTIPGSISGSVNGSGPKLQASEIAEPIDVNGLNKSHAANMLLSHSSDEDSGTDVNSSDGDESLEHEYSNTDLPKFGLQKATPLAGELHERREQNSSKSDNFLDVHKPSQRKEWVKFYSPQVSNDDSMVFPSMGSYSAYDGDNLGNVNPFTSSSSSLHEESAPNSKRSSILAIPIKSLQRRRQLE